MTNAHLRRSVAPQMSSGQTGASGTNSRSAARRYFARGGERYVSTSTGRAEGAQRVPFTSDDRPYQQYVRAIRTNWYIVFIVLIVALAGAAFVTIRAPNLYMTKLTFFVKTPAGQLDSALQGDAFGQKRVNSYIQLATTDRLLEPVLADNKLDMSTEALAAEISASSDPNTVLLTVTVTDPSSERSLAIADSISTEFVKAVADLESASTGPSSGVGLELVSGPSLDSTPISPRPLMNFGLAALAGLIAGLGLAVLRSVLDTAIRSPETLESCTGAPVVGVIPADDSAIQRPLATESGVSICAEAFRVLRTNLEFMDVNTPAKSLLITSAITEEGKSRTAIGLAVALADAGKQVLLIDGNLRRPKVAQYLGIESAMGLTNVLAGQASVLDTARPWGRANLKVLVSGPIVPNPAELLGSNGMKTLLDTVIHKFDVVLIDAPALLAVADAAVMAAHADATVLVVRCGSATRRHVGMAAGALEKVHARLIGSVLNSAPTRADDLLGYTQVANAAETATGNRSADRTSANGAQKWSKDETRHVGAAGDLKLGVKRRSRANTTANAVQAPSGPISRPTVAQGTFSVPKRGSHIF